MSRLTIVLSAGLLVVSSSLAVAQSQRGTESDLPKAATKTWPDAGTPSANERSERERDKMRQETTGAGDRSDSAPKDRDRNR